jgi:MFS family permease
MSGEPKGPGRALRSASYVLALATLLNFVNYIDRFILAAVLPRIKSELVLNDFQLGMLANAFLVAYFITSPLFGRLGDRRSRPRLIAAGINVARLYREPDRLTHCPRMPLVVLIAVWTLDRKRFLRHSSATSVSISARAPSRSIASCASDQVSNSSDKYASYLRRSL